MDIVYKKRKSKFIHRFENKYKSIRCPQFFILSWAHRCAFQCSYCYLNLTFRYENSAIAYSNSDVMLEEAKAWLSETKEPSVLNTGELADSFLLQENKSLAALMDIFETQNKHFLLFLTKHYRLPSEIENNILNKFYKQSIFSFSINSHLAAKKFEIGCPNPFERLALAYTLKKHKQRVRIRIDPIIEIFDYEEEYKPLLNVLNNFIKPERITLGSLRFFKNLVNHAEDKEVFKFATDQDDEDKRLRIPFEKRTAIYKFFLDNLDCKDVGLCKETQKCHDLIKTKNVCNCMI